MTRCLITVLCAVALAAFGCGGSAEGESTTPVEEANPEPALEEEGEAEEEEALPPVDAGEEEEEDLGDELGEDLE